MPHTPEEKFKKSIDDQWTEIKKYSRITDVDKQILTLLKESNATSSLIEYKYTRAKYSHPNFSDKKVRKLQLSVHKSNQILGTILLPYNPKDSGENSLAICYDKNLKQSFLFHMAKGVTPIFAQKSEPVWEVAEDFIYNGQTVKRGKLASNLSQFPELFHQYFMQSTTDEIIVEHTYSKFDKDPWHILRRIKAPNTFKNIQLLPDVNYLEKTFSLYEGHSIRNIENKWIKINQTMKNAGIELFSLFDRRAKLASQYNLEGDLYDREANYLDQFFSESHKILLADALIETYYRQFYLHNLVHTDIKPENICIQVTNNQEKPFIINFIDMTESLALVDSSENLSKRRDKTRGTCEYLAPEFLETLTNVASSLHQRKIIKNNYKDYFSSSSDIYALGLTLKFLELPSKYDKIIHYMLDNDPDRRCDYFSQYMQFKCPSVTRKALKKRSHEKLDQNIDESNVSDLTAENFSNAAPASKMNFFQVDQKENKASALNRAQSYEEDNPEIMGILFGS